MVSSPLQRARATAAAAADALGLPVDVDDDLTAISNGPEVERTTTDGRTVIRFADTMVMSSYLVAFVVGRLEMTDPVDVDGTLRPRFEWIRQR